jgi:hypothetical protein
MIISLENDEFKRTFLEGRSPAKATAAGLPDFADQFPDLQAVKLLDPPFRRVI